MSSILMILSSLAGIHGRCDDINRTRKEEEPVCGRVRHGNVFLFHRFHAIGNICHSVSRHIVVRLRGKF